jgi:uncharacterized protein YyaL (SSP411 family)
MPTWGRRGSFSAITFTAVALTVVAVVAYFTRPAIPQPDPNSLVSYKARFLARAARQAVKWRVSDSDPFADARALDRPVMVFAGSAACQAARTLDEDVFSNREVAARLNNDFVCVRVDTDQEPEWRGAYLPMIRGELADPGYALLFFAPDGTFLTWIGRRAWYDKPDFNDFLGRLSEITAQSKSLDGPTQAQGEQSQERQDLRGGGSVAVPDVDGFIAAIGTPIAFWQWHGGMYRVLLQSGDLARLNTRLTADLRSPRVDLVDGGFFRVAFGPDPRYVEFDKSATDCAEMLAVLARAYVTTNDPFYKYWYDRSLKCLRSQFFATEPWSAHIEVETEEDGRSARNSFGAAVQRASSDLVLRRAAIPLGLVQRENPLMVPFVVEGLPMPEWIASLQRVSDSSVVDPLGDAWLDSSAFVVARTFEAASVLRDDEALQLARQWSSRLHEFRAGSDEVRHATQGRGMARRWLGDYAAFADAMFEQFVATGDEEKLTEGEAVLRRALEVYSQADPGDVVAVVHSDAGVPLDMPSIVDGDEPPALPELMLACFRYGCVLGDRELRQRAAAIAQRFAPVANGRPWLFSSYFAAAQEVMLTGCTVTSSPDLRASVRQFPPSVRNGEVGARGRVYAGSN